MDEFIYENLDSSETDEVLEELEEVEDVPRSKTKKELDEELMTRMAAAVEETPVLWDQTRKGYHDITLKSNAWQRIATLCGLESGAEASKKFTAYRNRWYKQKKIYKEFKSGSGQKGPIPPIVACWQFLENAKIPNRFYSNFPSPSSSSHSSQPPFVVIPSQSPPIHPFLSLPSASLSSPSPASPPFHCPSRPTPTPSPLSNPPPSPSPSRPTPTPSPLSQPSPSPSGPYKKAKKRSAEGEVLFEIVESIKTLTQNRAVKTSEASWAESVGLRLGEMMQTMAPRDKRELMRRTNQFLDDYEEEYETRQKNDTTEDN